MPSSESARLERAERAGQLMSAKAADFLHGCVRVATERGGWARPWRFADAQVRTMGSCQAWHPGLFRQMARTTAGVTLEFETDATEVALEVLLDAEPTGTTAVLDDVPGRDEAPLDGLSADVDGHHLPARMPASGEAVVTFAVDDPTRSPRPGLVMLPGFGETHHVRIWLPALRGCAVRRLWGNGTAFEPVPARPQLLVIGDSIAQGFVTEDPATAWPSVLADRLGLDLVNQGLGGQVFQPGSLLGLPAHVDPERVVVALGENYRYEPCRARPTARDVRNYLVEVTRLWPDVPTWVCTPAWHDEAASPSHAMSCWERVPSMIAANVAVHDQMALVDGTRLMDADAGLLADGYEHPNAEGAAQLAVRLHVAMLARRGTAEERRERALGVLDGAPTRAFPVLENVRRGTGQIVLAEEGCVLVGLDDGQCLLYAPDHELGAAALAALVETPVVGLCEPALEPVAAARGYTDRDPYHLAIYEHDAPLGVDLPEGGSIRVLGEEWAPQVMARYSHPEYLSMEGLRASLRSGLFLGAFDGDELVGFVGEHAEGSIGLLEVFEGHRREGWGRALESSKINEALARGWVPWAEVFPGNRASLALQRSLGMTVTPSTEQCYVGLPMDRPADAPEALPADGAAAVPQPQAVG